MIRHAPLILAICLSACGEATPPPAVDGAAIASAVKHAQDKADASAASEGAAPEDSESDG